MYGIASVFLEGQRLFVASVKTPITYVVDVQIIMINVFMASVGVIEKALSFLYFQSSC